MQRLNIPESKIDELIIMLKKHPMSTIEICQFCGVPIPVNSTNNKGESIILHLEKKGFLIYVDDYAHYGILSNNLLDEYEEKMRNVKRCNLA